MSSESKRKGVLFLGIVLVLIGSAVCLVGIVLLTASRHGPAPAGQAVHPDGRAGHGHAARDASSAQIAELEKQRLDLQARLATAEAKLTAAEDRLAIQQKAESGLQKEKLNELRLARDDLEAQVKKVVGERDAVAKSLAGAQSELAAVRATLKTSDEQLARAKSDVAALKAAEAKAAESNAALTRQAADLQAARGAAEARAAALEKSQKEFEARCKELEAKLAPAPAAASAPAPAPAK